VNLKAPSSSIPNDPFIFPNAIIDAHQYHLAVQANGLSIDFSSTWQLAKGHAMVGLMDTEINGNHPDLLGNFRHHLFAPYIVSEQPLSYQGIYNDHGSCVLSVLAPPSNNNEGLTGVYQDCNVVADSSFFCRPYNIKIW